MKFKIYHSSGASHANPIDVEAKSVEEAAAIVEQRTGGHAIDASAFLEEFGQWIAVDIWRDYQEEGDT